MVEKEFATMDEDTIIIDAVKVERYWYIFCIRYKIKYKKGLFIFI